MTVSLEAGHGSLRVDVDVPTVVKYTGSMYDIILIRKPYGKFQLHASGVGSYKEHTGVRVCLGETQDICRSLREVSGGLVLGVFGVL